nr:hypothetical protein [Tanacetum cinerariifolium]
GSSQNNIDDKGYWDSGCFRHMTGIGGKEAEFVQQYVLLPLWSSGSKGPQNTDVAAFEFKEPESAVHVSPSSCDKTKKHDDKTKREAKDKSPIELSTGVRDLSDEFKEFSNNSTNGVNAASTSVTIVRQNLTNSTNTFSVAGPFNNAVSLNFELGGKSSFVDPFQYPDDPDMPAMEDITYSDDEEDVVTEADFSNLKTSITASPILTTRVRKDHPVTQIIGDLSLAPQTRSMTTMVKEQGQDVDSIFIIPFGVELTLVRNKEMDDFCSQKGIKREFSNARTPQQNGVAERRNRTLIEAAKTMVLVNKSHNKTPYELFNGRSPAIGFLKPFGCYVMFLNTLDRLGKFKAKGDKGTKDAASQEVKKDVSSLRYIALPNWVHDALLENSSIDAGTNSTNLFGTKDAANQKVKKVESSLRYIVLPNWAHDDFLESTSSKPYEESSTQVPEGSGNPNPTAFSSNPPADQIETLTVESPIPTVRSLVLTACLNDSSEPSIEARLVSKRVANQEETPSLETFYL